MPALQLSLRSGVDRHPQRPHGTLAYLEVRNLRSSLLVFHAQRVVLLARHAIPPLLAGLLHGGILPPEWGSALVIQMRLRSPKPSLCVFRKMAVLGDRVDKWPRFSPHPPSAAFAVTTKCYRSGCNGSFVTSRDATLRRRVQ